LTPNLALKLADTEGNRRPQQQLLPLTVTKPVTNVEISKVIFSRDIKCLGRSHRERLRRFDPVSLDCRWSSSSTWLSLGIALGNGSGSMAMLRSAGDLGLVMRTGWVVCAKFWSTNNSLEILGYARESRDAELTFPISGSRPISVPAISEPGQKDSRPRSDQKPGSNTHKTNSLPKESESSFVKFVRGRGYGYIRYKREKALGGDEFVLFGW